jgi:hypothetical protein
MQFTLSSFSTFFAVAGTQSRVDHTCVCVCVDMAHFGGRLVKRVEEAIEEFSEAWTYRLCIQL